MKRIVTGILAHVDSGKTTLTEAILYSTGHIKKLGRVDHKDAFLDTDRIERDRGITIFSKQAIVDLDDTRITIVDTPGHVDFSTETERVLPILDYAVLVISGTDGVQSHTRTLWNLLEHYHVPTFVFVNKMDLPGTDKDRILRELKEVLSDSCVDFSNINDEFFEEVAMQSDSLMEEYLNKKTISQESIVDAVSGRMLFPCCFGAALKNDGVDTFLNILRTYTKQNRCSDEFGGKVFKISEDEKGTRLTHVKITGGSLSVKTLLQGDGWSEKVNDIRIYSGEKFTSVKEASFGDVCALVGLSKTAAGDGLGFEENEDGFLCEPIFTYSVKLPDGMDVSQVLPMFKKLEQEESRLQITVNTYLQKINVRIMGEIQLEVLKRVISDRFGLEVEFEQGSILYKETISNPVEGVGHYEPLRHYAEVHLLMEPLKQGSGLVFETKCSDDVLARNWQRLVMTHLAEKTHLGVLTGSEITDMKVTLINGRAHQKHTDGGDFRQATYRAVRQGLMQAECVLLEPYYRFVLEVPTECTGRALNDFQQMGAEFEPPMVMTDYTRITGEAAVSEIGNYHKTVIAYSKGLGRLSLAYSGYKPCKNSEKVIEEINYNCAADVENTADSVFCAHGSGFVVKWDEVFDYMDIPLFDNGIKDGDLVDFAPKYQKIIASDSELLKIFEQTYGKIKERELPAKAKMSSQPQKPYKAKKPVPIGPEYVLVDGYNIIYAWEELREISNDSPDAARAVLISRMSNYCAMKQNNVILVFDAYKVKGNLGEIEKVNNITVVYTKEAETADSYIEKTSKELSKNYRVRVATSDLKEQLIVFGNGAMRVSAEEFKKEVDMCEKEMREIISRGTK